jgi:putative peptidoglycan lipid II flippase
LLGLPIVEEVFQLLERIRCRRKFVYLVLAAYSIGLPASTSSRVLQGSFYAHGDPDAEDRPAVAMSLAVGLPAMPGSTACGSATWRSSVLPAASLRLGAVGLACGDGGCQLELGRCAAPPGAAGWSGPLRRRFVLLT